MVQADNRCLAIGDDIHYCLGAPLAPLARQIAFATLLGRFPILRLAGDYVTYKRSFDFRALTALPVEFGV